MYCITKTNVTKIPRAKGTNSTIFLQQMSLTHPEAATHQTINGPHATEQVSPHLNWVLF